MITNTKEFVRKSKIVHGDKYCYLKAIYDGSKTTVAIICKNHGEFVQSPNKHLSGRGCPKCGRALRAKSLSKSKEDFIVEANKVHNDKYDYVKFIYANNREKGVVICPDHGRFQQTPSNHLRGSGCPKCAIEYNIKRKTSSIEEFIEKSSKIHNNKYDYSKAIYRGDGVKAEIICPDHGEFQQSPSNHLQGRGCLKCSGKQKSNTKEFIKKAKMVHGDIYDYSSVDYVNNRICVEIICFKHGKFPQAPTLHLRKQGCPKCNESKGEKKIAEILNSLNKIFEQEKVFSTCKNKRSLPFDFYLPDQNLLIEYDGKQHFKPTWFGKAKNRNEEQLAACFKRIQLHDLIKTKWAKDNAIKLIRIPYTQFNNIESILRKALC